MLKNYKALKVWEKAYKLFLDIYTVTKCFPKKEIYGLTSQIKRGARRCRENVKSDDQITGKQTLESLNRNSERIPAACCGVSERIKLRQNSLRSKIPCSLLQGTLQSSTP